MPNKSVRTFLISERKQHSEDCFHQLILWERNLREFMVFMLEQLKKWGKPNL